MVKVRNESWMKIGWMLLIVAAMSAGCESATVDNQGAITEADLQGVNADAAMDAETTGTSTIISSSGSAGPWDGTAPSMKVRQIPPRSVSVTTDGIIDRWPPSGAKGARAILTVDGHRADYMTPGLLRGSPRVPEGLYTKWGGGPVRKGQIVSIGLKPFSGNGKPISVKVTWILEPVN